MPPDLAPLALSLRARALWIELAALYDGIEQQLRLAAWDEGSALALHLAEVEASLAPLMTAIAVLRGGPVSDPALLRVWCEIDGIAARLAARLPAVIRA